MIHIQRIIIKGFKNIKEVELKLDKITSLLSNNSYGKSNVLMGIAFGISFLSLSYDEREALMSYKSYLPLNNKIKTKQYEFEVEFDTEINNEPYNIIYGYSFLWAKNEKRPSKIIKEYLKVKKTNETQKYTIHMKRENENAFYKSSLTGICDKEIKIRNHELVINKLNAYDDLFYLDIINLINNNLKMYVDRHFDSENFYSLFPFVMKKESLINDVNIPRILYMIKKEYHSKYNLLINTFKDLFPTVEDIEIMEYKINSENFIDKSSDINEPFELSDTIYRIFAKDINLVQKIPFELMSDGAKRVLMVFAYITLASIHNYPLIAIEEPENSVHPKLLQQYLQALDNLLENSKIIITSHSPNLINYIEPSKIYLGIPNDEGIANFYKIKSNATNRLMRVAKDLNMLVGDYLFDLMSGTDDDILELSTYVEQ